MTNDQIHNIFKAASGISLTAGLRAIWNAGWYEGAGQTPTANSEDKSLKASKPVAVVAVKKV